jgi:glyoxylase-like metal-dependent hydrolase (beta-lactamase superfamily II)
MTMTNVVTMDLHFQNRTHAIASYLIRSGDAVVLVESGPGSTLSALEAGLAKEGLSTRDVTHLLLSHIHLDHAGAAGWLSRQGAQVYVHPVGAPHMLNPEKLIASASKIYGDRMDSLWGEFLPVSPDKLVVAQDAEEIIIGNLHFLPVNTPGHAEHHYCYVFEDLCFSGDVGGVRMPGYPYMRVPMPPPELHFGKWRESIARMRELNCKRVAPTHFGIYDDVDWHLKELQGNLDANEAWLEGAMKNDPPVETLRAELTAWMEEQTRLQGLSEEVIQAYTVANPVGMSADGMLRYWKKFRAAG